ncbi:MAG: hypothetical protein N3A38_07175 [Planctomycetota bacterium]|nr:hypothetical protein [Planctomycetota bacterium]
MVWKPIRLSKVCAVVVAVALPATPASRCEDTKGPVWTKDMNEAKRAAAKGRKLIVQLIGRTDDDKSTKVKDALPGVPELKEAVFIWSEAHKDSWPQIYRVPCTEKVLPAAIIFDADGRRWASAAALTPESLPALVRKATERMHLPWAKDIGAARSRARAENIPVLIFVGSDVDETSRKAMDGLAGSVAFQKAATAFVDAESDQAWAVKLKVDDVGALPVVLITNADGKLIRKFCGAEVTSDTIRKGIAHAEKVLRQEEEIRKEKEKHDPKRDNTPRRGEVRQF